MPPLTWHDAVFSAKTFGAAMLAVYVAFRLQLPQPGWAMLTVYIVSQPLAGMVLSKSVFRAVGTVIGAVFALMAVDLFADAPAPMSLSICAMPRHPTGRCSQAIPRPSSVFPRSSHR
jgi:uncharacterized membrane protein YccC